MVKKEINEIRKQMKPSTMVARKLCGCYVDSEKNIKYKLKTHISSLPEEDEFKYYEIFKKTLSGKLDQKLYNINFPRQAEEKGGAANLLYRLKNSQLDTDKYTDEMYQKIIENYNHAGNFYIILTYCVYDVPGKASDGTTIDSTDVFDFVLCSICPVDLSKPGLGYNEKDNKIEDRIRDWVVGNPECGFMYPAFNDRAADIHSALYYTKNGKIDDNFTEELFGVQNLVSAEEEKELFKHTLESTLEEECSYNVVRDIYSELLDKIENNTSEEPVTITKDDIVSILKDNKVSKDRIHNFELDYDKNFNANELRAESVVEKDTFNIDTGTVKIKVTGPEIIETKIIDGRRCLVISLEDRLEVNGINTY